MLNPNNARLSDLTGLPGWESPAEERLLMQYAALVPAGGRIVEIGAEFGMSAGAFALGAAPSVTIVSIDLYPGELLKIHRANMAEAGLEHRTVQIVGDSHELDWTQTAWLFSPVDSEPLELDTTIDLLFIDGDHSRNGVFLDTRYCEFVPVGGHVIFHDVAQTENTNPHPSHFEVAEAVYEWVNGQAGEWYHVDSADSARVYRRGPIQREIDS